MTPRRPATGTIPDAPGSYQFKDVHGRVIYVGKAANLRHRLANYFAPPHSLHVRTRQDKHELPDDVTDDDIAQLRDVIDWVGFVQGTLLEALDGRMLR